MRTIKQSLLPVFLVGLWINISESIRWIFLIENYWIEHYEQLGLTFPGEALNMVTWMIWGFLYATLIFILAKKFNLLQTMLIVWSAVFFMMWIVVWNVGILPVDMLGYNIPLSLLEAYIAVLICKALIKKSARSEIDSGK